MEKQDLRGIVTIVVVAIFALAIFIPFLTEVMTGNNVLIPEALLQATIQFTGIVIAFYFGNKATKEKMD